MTSRMIGSSIGPGGVVDEQRRLQSAAGRAVVVVDVDVDVGVAVGGADEAPPHHRHPQRQPSP